MKSISSDSLPKEYSCFSLSPFFCCVVLFSIPPLLIMRILLLLHAIFRLPFLVVHIFSLPPLVCQSFLLPSFWAPQDSETLPLCAVVELVEQGVGWGEVWGFCPKLWGEDHFLIASFFVPVVVSGNRLLGLHYKSLSRGTPLPKPWLCFIAFSGYSVNIQQHSQTQTEALERFKMLDKAKYRENGL